MKCEVRWRRLNNSIVPDSGCGAEAVCLVAGTALDADCKDLQPIIFAVCEEHAEVGTTSGWVKISSHVAKCIGQMEEALRKAP